MEYKNYDVSSVEDAKQSLKTFGVAVLPNQFTEDKCQECRNGIWLGISHITQGRFDVRDKSTWSEFYKFQPKKSMLLQHWVGHLQTVWNIRQHPTVVNLFAELWNTRPDNLLVSFDGISVAFPPETTKKGWYHRADKSLHSDQSSHKRGLHCIQGFVNLYDVNKGDATLTILEGSHKHHADFFAQFGLDVKDDWFKLNEPAHQQFFAERGCRQTCIQVGAGSIVLWDSRTMHAGIQPQQTRAAPNKRMVVYVSMLPRERTPTQVLAKRLKAFEQLRMTTHWTDKCQLFPTVPRNYGTPFPEFNRVEPPVLTALGRSLVGY